MELKEVCCFPTCCFNAFQTLVYVTLSHWVIVHQTHRFGIDYVIRSLRCEKFKLRHQFSFLSFVSFRVHAATESVTHFPGLWCCSCLILNGSTHKKRCERLLYEECANCENWWTVTLRVTRAKWTFLHNFSFWSGTCRLQILNDCVTTEFYSTYIIMFKVNN